MSAAGTSTSGTLQRYATNVVASTDTEILRRVIQPDKPGFPSEAARFVLNLDFPESDHRRITELSDKANAGSLSPEEREELAGYVRVSDFLSFVQSKARLSLRDNSER